MKRTFELLGLSLVSAAIALSACANDASCDEGQKVVEGSCVYVAPEEPDAGAPGDGGAAGASANLQAPNVICDANAPPSASFGQPCSDAELSSDCACPAPVCA